MLTADVVIVGGGIWGLSTAYHLSRTGNRQIALLERNPELAQETTRQSAGQVGRLRADPVLARAVGYTIDLLTNFAELEGVDPGFVRSGSLHLSLCPQRTDMFHQLRAAAEKLGVSSSELGPQDVAELSPFVRAEAVDAALYVDSDGYVDARSCALAYATAAQRRGVDMHLSAAVSKLEPRGGALVVHAGDLQITTPQVIMAGGPWTGELAGMLGLHVPMFPIRLQQARTTTLDVPPNHPVVRVPDASCYVRPEAGGLLYGYFDPEPLPIDLAAQPAGFRTADVLSEPELVEASQRRLHEVIPDLAQCAIAQYRQGMMTCTPDGRFVIGAAPEWAAADGPQVWVATGCGGTGIAASGAVGRWLAELASSGQTTDEIGIYDPARFGAQAADSAWLRERACETSAAYYRLASPTAD